ncbi:hypothetical protein BGY98DRAFT_1031822 [Russula aff. rugulosa BPL654]|nr:hypothetical protein BGY98DRAFT_1031822 [Russula aff. rugulosa BPL654]
MQESISYSHQRALYSPEFIFSSWCVSFIIFLCAFVARIPQCFQPLEMHLEFLTTEMTDLIIQIMVEVLSIFGIAMVEIKQGHIRNRLKVLIGKSEIKDSLERLDWPIQGHAVNAEVINTVDDKVTLVDMVATSDKVTSGRSLDQLPEPLDRHVCAHAAGYQEAEPGSCPSPTALPRCGYSPSPCGGACRSPCG